jgi:hypothetical protein
MKTWDGQVRHQVNINKAHFKAVAMLFSITNAEPRELKSKGGVFRTHDVKWIAVPHYYILRSIKHVNINPFVQSPDFMKWKKWIGAIYYFSSIR